MKSSALEYELPPELIAQHPATRRDESRLLVYERSSGAVRHRTFAELPDQIRDALVVVNDTRVVPAARGRRSRRPRPPRGAVRGRAGRVGADRRRVAGGRRGHDDRPRAGDARPRRSPQGQDRPLRDPRLRVPPRRRAGHELPPSTLDAPRARHGVRRRRGDPRALRGGDSRALPLLLLPRRHARAGTYEVTATDGE